MVNCCVFNCPSNQFKRRGITFHPFPCEDDMRQRWLKNIARPQWEPPDSARVCSLHFKADSYRKGFKYKVLHMDAMPTLFPPKLYPGAELCKSSKPRKPRSAGVTPKKAKISQPASGNILDIGQNGSTSFCVTMLGAAAVNATVSSQRGRKFGSGKTRIARSPGGSRPPRKRKQQSSVIGAPQRNPPPSEQPKQFVHQLLSPPVGVHHVSGLPHPFAGVSHPLESSHQLVACHPQDPSHHPHAIGHLLGVGNQNVHHPQQHQQLHGCSERSAAGDNVVQHGEASGILAPPSAVTVDSSGASVVRSQTAPPSANYDAVEAHIQTIKEENEISILKKKLKNKEALVRRRDKTIVELASQLSSMERKCANAVAQTPVATAANSGSGGGNSSAFAALAAAHCSGDPGARFLMEQVEAFAARERHQWSDFALEHCALWHLKSAEAYAYVKDAGLLRLPSRDTIILCTGVGELSMPETPGGAGVGGGGSSGDVLFADKLTAAVLL